MGPLLNPMRFIKHLKHDIDVVVCESQIHSQNIQPILKLGTFHVIHNMYKYIFF